MVTLNKFALSFFPEHADLSEMKFPMITVYDDKTLDFPGEFVARLFEVRPGQVLPTNLVVVRPTYEDMVAAIPPWFTRLARNPNDDPHIIETWMK